MYHEIAVQNEDLIRKLINSMCRISKTPGDSLEAQLDFKEILEQVLEKIPPLPQGNEEMCPQIVQLKIATCGADFFYT